MVVALRSESAEQQLAFGITTQIAVEKLDGARCHLHTVDSEGVAFVLALADKPAGPVPAWPGRRQTRGKASVESFIDLSIGGRFLGAEKCGGCTAAHVAADGVVLIDGIPSKSDQRSRTGPR